MKKRSILPSLAAVLLCSVLAAGCSGSSTGNIEGLDKLGAIHAVTREKDSGTRASFDDLTGITVEAEDITVAESTEDMLAAVSDSSSIGYLTSQAVTDDVKALQVNGKSVDDKSYPLTRQLYLCYKGELSDVEKEFITYVTGKGQEIVAEEFEAVGKADTFLSLKPSGSILIGGSSSEAPVMEELAKAYMELNPNASITVETTDSGTGISNALEGTYDLGMSSRKPKSYEKDLLTFETIARDRIAVITGKDNPLDNITAAQLKKIYTGELTDWADLPSVK
ncbi:MAG: substrate-binding domain-containing protein [Eubacterium sp.]|nr:substrate-binding domain-containing protein [Eubacterium sp.]